MLIKKRCTLIFKEKLLVGLTLKGLSKIYKTRAIRKTDEKMFIRFFWMPRYLMNTFEYTFEYTFEFYLIHSAKTKKAAVVVSPAAETFKRHTGTDEWRRNFHDTSENGIEMQHG